MTSELSVELRTLMRGLFDSTIAGVENPTNIGQIDTGRLGVARALGYFERDLMRTLRRSGVPEESIQDIVQRTTQYVQELLLGMVEFYTLGTLKQPTGPKKPQLYPFQPLQYLWNIFIFVLPVSVVDIGPSVSD